MKRALLILGLCLVAAAVTASTSAIAAGTATTAKKKKTYCQKQAAGVKAKLFAKSHKFYVFKEKGGASILICQDKPKFFASFGTDPGAKYSQLRVSAKKCAIVTSKPPNENADVFAFDFANFTSKGNSGSASVFQVGYDQGPAVLLQTALSANCVSAYGIRVNGVPQIAVKGTSAFGYTGTLYPKIGANMTDKELADVKVVGSGATATLSWSESGVKHTYVYINGPQTQYPAPTT
jgi:hypothetical protein